MSDESRAKFEALANDRGWSLEREHRLPEVYMNDGVQERWEVWCFAWNQATPPKPVGVEEIEELLSDLESAWMKIDSSTEEEHLASTLRIQNRRNDLLAAITKYKNGSAKS